MLMLILQSTSVLGQKRNDTRRLEGITMLNVSSDNWDGANETRMSFEHDGKKYRVRVNGSKIAEMYVDGQKVNETEFAKYDSLVQKILEQIAEDRKQAELDRKQAEKDRERAAKDREQAELDRKEADQHRRQAELDRVQADKDRLNADNDRRQAERDRERAMKDRERAELDRKQADKDRAQAEVDRKKAEEDRKMWEQMIDEVVADKIIGNRDELKSLLLSDDELTVNGVKQPDSTHKKFRSKYLKGERTKISYRNSDGFRGMSID